MNKQLSLAGMMIACAASAMAAATLPVPTGLAAEAEGRNVKLTWTAPVIPEGGTVTESFETCAPFITDGIGAWTMVDVDKMEQFCPSYYLNNWEQDKDLIGYEQAYSWIVYNNDPFYYNIFEPRTKDDRQVLATFFSYESAADNWAISPELSGDAQKISFYATSLGDAADVFDVLYSTTGTDIESFTAIERNVKIYNGWDKFEYDLPKGALYFAIRYTAEAESAHGMAIDDVTFATSASEPLELVGYNVWRDGVKLTAEPVDALEFSDADAARADHTYTVTAVYTAGESEQSKAVSFEANKLPVPTALTGQVDGSDVVLSWTAPEAPEAGPASVTESFENYESYITEGVGSWTFVDVDGQETFCPSYYLADYDDEPTIKYGEAYAWIVYSNDLFAYDVFSQRSDNNRKALVSFFSYEAAADDWAISPRLSGEQQTVSFYATSLENVDVFDVLYSTTDTDINSFTALARNVKVYNTWDKFEYELPEGARYFAIRYTAEAESAYGVAIDDVTYAPELAAGPEVTGYNVYRDGEKLTAEPVAETSYRDIAAASDNHVYSVTAVYGDNESLESDAYTHDKTTAIAGVDAAPAITVTTLDGRIIVSGTDSALIYTIDGRLVASGTDVALPAGLYIVRAAGAAVKVAL